jgi:hypothetical protein
MINDLPNQIKKIKLQLEKLLPGNKLFTTVCSGWISFWEGVGHKVFEIQAGEDISDEELLELLDEDAVAEITHTPV